MFRVSGVLSCCSSCLVLLGRCVISWCRCSMMCVFLLVVIVLLCCILCCMVCSWCVIVFSMWVLCKCVCRGW